MKAFLQIFCFGRVVYIDAVVIRIQCFHEIGVEFLPQQRNGLALGRQLRAVRNDLFPEMEINESGRREFGRARRKGGIEGALMVVIAVGLRRVFPPDIDDGMAG